MAYDHDLNPVIDRVLNEVDIRQGLDAPTSSVNDAYLRARLHDTANAIWDEAAKQIADYETVENEIAHDREHLRAQLVKLPRDVIIGFWFVLGAIGLLLLIMLTDSVSALGSYYLFGLGISFPTLLYDGIMLWMVAAALRLIIYFRLLAISEDRSLSQQRIDLALRTTDSLRVAADDAVFAAAVQNATRIINEASATFFQDHIVLASATRRSAKPGLRETSASGLAEILNPTNEIATEARARVMHMVRTLPGASIGVAGPRGAGKSSLLWSVCGTNPKIGDAEAIAINSSAPVEYDARDFLLHIFATLCLQVMKTKGARDDHRAFTSVEDPEEVDARRTIYLAFRRIGILVGILGVCATMIGFSIAFFLSIVLPSTLALQNGGGTAVTVKSASLLTKVLTALDLKPGGLVQWGLTAWAVGFVSAYGASAFSFRGRPRSRWVDHEDALVVECRRALSDIRFQRSYSSGWSGSFKMLAGIESSATRAVSIAQRQKSLPEIVQQFKEFVMQVTREYPCVLIAVDELDKIGSDEKAQQFINEIKAIFNVPKCFYLIAVSENAISSFERRGLPFRNAFDSAFDDIQRVDYMPLSTSRNLLARRVISLPGPFLCLCHAISGGLPRDLIRATRAMLEYVREREVENSLSAVTSALFKREIRNKLRATSTVAREVTLEPESATFLEWAASVEAADPFSAEFQAAMMLPAPVEREDLTEDERTMSRVLGKYRAELDAFAAYAVTSIELFTSIRSETDWRTAETGGWVEGLAKARQALEVSPAVARIRINDLRVKTALSALW